MESSEEQAFQPFKKVAINGNGELSPRNFTQENTAQNNIQTEYKPPTNQNQILVTLHRLMELQNNCLSIIRQQTTIKFGGKDSAFVPYNRVKKTHVTC